MGQIIIYSYIHIEADGKSINALTAMMNLP